MPISQPLHTVYGGAHLFRAGIARKLGDLALASFETLDLELAPRVRERVVARLRASPVADYRIDFEDGFGMRSDAEEDAAAERAAGAITGDGPPLGIRIKPFTAQYKERALRTLDIFLSRELPPGFVVTLPKVTAPGQVAGLAARCEPHGVAIEILVETPECLRNLPAIAAAGRGLLRGAHFGAFDYLGAIGVPWANQSLLHPACDFARHTMQAQLAGTGLWLSDGVTHVLPIAPAVEAGWRLHYSHVRHALASGFWQGWDVHPAQIPARLAALYSFFHENLDQAAERLRNFHERAERATRLGAVFDDAATARGLTQFFERGVACGALTREEAIHATA